MSNEIKCIVWDLDNTIWDGILLESDGVFLKPGIIEILKTLDSRGIINSIASKNNIIDAMMKLNDFKIDELFIYPEINWNVKSYSIERIKTKLNIGYDTILFIDDQEFERKEVESVHNEVMIVDAKVYQDLPNYQRLNPRFITQDSKRRRKMYQEDILRKIEENNFKGPSEKFLASLEMKFIISEAKEEDLKRAEELTVRTNQLNATGKTYSYDELNHFRTSEKYRLYVCELNDKYGTYGKIGLALVEITETYWNLKMMLMSCRVISRGVGSILMTHIMIKAKKEKKKLLADFQQTDKNRRMYITFKFANFKEISNEGNGNILFEHDLASIPKFPYYINVIIK